MKTIILLITGIALANLVGAAEKITIAAAHGLPDHTKFVAADEMIERVFGVAFATGDFNEDGRVDLVVQTADPLSPDFTHGV